MRQVERTCKRNHMEIESKSTPDVLVRNEGTVFLFCPLTPHAREWIDEYVQSDAQWFGNALVVEHRYAWGLAEGMNFLQPGWRRIGEHQFIYDMLCSVRPRKRLDAGRQR
jgi:hypothetical protein